MSVNVQFIYDTPQREIASILSGLYANCASASLIAGFMTVEGIETVADQIASAPAKLAELVIGAGTWRAFDAFDRLLGLGVIPDRLRVHLGHSRPTGGGAKHPFYRYHPMLHSKVYLFEMPQSTTTAFVGSHNLTGFALTGLNGEAGVLLDGDASEQVFSDVRAHIAAAASASVQYDPAQREAYAWWAEQFMEGLADKFDDLPRQGEAKNTIIIVAELTGPTPPRSNEVIYFELPKAIGKVQSLRAEVHLFLFDKLPPSPSIALTQLAQAHASFWCRTVGVEDDQGGAELRASWYIDGKQPKLRRAPVAFRPKPGSDMQQVRIKTYKAVRGDFEYLFERGRASFEPVFDQKAELTLKPQFHDRSVALESFPRNISPGSG